MLKASRSSVLFIVLFLGAPLARATDFFVSPAGTGPYPNIQAAVDAAADGDMIFLFPGVFTGPGNQDVEVPVGIWFESNDPFDPAIIDCQGSADEPHRAFRLLGGASTMRFLTIRNGHADDGGAIKVESGDLTLEGCLIQDNHADARGGGIFAGQGAGLNLRITILSGNQADDGPAIWAEGGADHQLFRCTVHRNRDGYLLTDTGQIALGTTGSLALEQVLISAGEYAAGVASQGGLVTAVVCDVHGNYNGDYVGPLAGLLGVDGNMNEYPRHCDSGAPEAGLNDQSPCLAQNNPNGLIIGARGQGCTSESGVGGEETLPTLAVAGAFPNPFNPRTEIRFRLGEAKVVTLEILDASGRRVRQLAAGRGFAAGDHRVLWDGADDAGRAQPSGVYFYSLTASGERRTGKMALVR